VAGFLLIYARDEMKQIRFSLVSLGCPKALIDSEIILGLMVTNGHLLCGEVSESDLVIVNTCCFIKDAYEESAGAIRDALRLKAEGLVRRVVVYGCIAEREGSEVLTRFRGVDAVVGLNGKGELPELCVRLLGSKSDGRVFLPGVGSDSDDGQARLRVTPGHYAYLKISEGCDNRCSYCVIPSIRGPLRSRSVEALASEAEGLVNDGVVEINLVGQDTAAFGSDISIAFLLPRLISRLSSIDDLMWIRILYAHPAHLVRETIEAIAQSDKVVKYIDMPVQHASDRILKAMGRKTTKRGLLDLISTIRNEIEGVILRTTLMVGFPGESAADFDELMDFVRTVRFDRLGAFKYSREKGTAASEMPGQIPEPVKTERYERLMETQQKVAFEKNRNMVGTEVQVIVDLRSERPGFAWVGRTYGDAPDIDGKVFFADESLAPGTILKARIIGYDGYDLMACPADPAGGRGRR